MKALLLSTLFILSASLAWSQNTELPCSYESMLNANLLRNPNAEKSLEETKVLMQKIIEEHRARPLEEATFVIPVVMHVFHYGDDGKMDMEQALSGLEILNNDFNGLNDGWDSIDEQFDSIKGSLDIRFCLATLDPQGNATTGLIYHEDENALYNEGNLFQHAWNNFKYLNIYFPKYTSGGPSDFTAYAYFPSTINTFNGEDGVFYSSIRWGYGNHSELEEGDDWASVCTHEVGHWLDLRHTFTNGCSALGDLVDDTPPTIGSGIELAGCNNNDYSCGVHTNGENFMDYNHRCKKMFTAGQIERMTAALFLPSRKKLWSQENLIETGCADLNTSTQNIMTTGNHKIFPNPASEFIVFKLPQNATQLKVLNMHGQMLSTYSLSSNTKRLDVSNFEDGIYYYTIISNNGKESGKFVVN